MLKFNTTAADELRGVKQMTTVLWKHEKFSCEFRNLVSIFIFLTQKTIVFFFFLFQGVHLTHNASARIIRSNQSLVLQKVTRNSSGNYACSALNSEGKWIGVVRKWNANSSARKRRPKSTRHERLFLCWTEAMKWWKPLRTRFFKLLLWILFFNRKYEQGTRYHNCKLACWAAAYLYFMLIL